ncbi:MAG: Bcr/CflA family efflux MFS transporter [Rhodobacteraceae bacterium]|nr:MAG: Bcr/CflA family efflux MFS transporter [Paracoccaceae bacterium]
MSAPRAPRWLDPSSPPHLFTLVALAALGALNMNAFLPSLPGMAADFAADYAVVQLAVSAYLAMTGALQLVIGPLSDRYGRRPVLIGCLGVFLFATACCVVAPTVEVFLFFRLLQSAVVSGLVLSRAIVRDMVGGAAAASRIGYVTMGMAVAPMIGPALGGFLDEAVGWRGVFAGLFTLGVATLLLTLADLGETNPHAGQSFGEQFRAYPELMRSRRFWGYALTSAFASGAFFAFLGGAPYVASEILGMSPSETGAYFGIIAAGYLIGNFLSGRFTQVVGLTGMMLAGSVTAVAAMVAATAGFHAGLVHPMTLFGTVFFVGLGNGLTMPSAMAGSLSVRPKLAGVAAGFGGALMIGGGAALSAWAGALLGPGTGPYPLLYVMAGASALAVVSTLYVMAIDRLAGPAHDVRTAEPLGAR